LHDLQAAFWLKLSIGCAEQGPLCWSVDIFTGCRTFKLAGKAQHGISEIQLLSHKYRKLRGFGRFNKLENRFIGLLVYRSVGLSVCWFIGLLVYRSVGLLVYRFIGLSVYRSIGLLGFRSIGLMVK
jgi:hypothetical protein